MKKVICGILALILSLSACALAESVPSKTTSDLTHFEIGNVPNQDGDNVFLQPDIEPERVETADKELQKLIVAESIEHYFGEVKDTEGNPVVLSEIMELLGDEELIVHDFTPIIAGGFESGCGDLDVVMNFPTVYQAGQKVIVLFGVETENVDANGDKIIEWIAVEGIGVESNATDMGAIEISIPEELVLTMQENNTILAVVSK